MFEFKNYFIIKTKSELLIDNSKSSSSLRINVDLTMHRIPCYVLNMDISDFTGAHTSNVKGTLVKKSLDKNGKVLTTDSSDINKKHEEKFTTEDVTKAFNEQQGCRLTGSSISIRPCSNSFITQIPVMNFEIEHAGKAVFSSTGTFSSLSAKPKHFIVTFPASSL